MSDLIGDLLNGAEDDFEMGKKKIEPETPDEDAKPELAPWLVRAYDFAAKKFPDSAELFEASRARATTRLSMSEVDRRRDIVKERMERRAAGWEVTSPMDCKFCNNTGWQIELRLPRSESDLLSGYEVAVQCSCRSRPKDPRDPTPGTTRKKRASGRRAGRKPVRSWKDAAAGDGAHEEDAKERKVADFEYEKRQREKREREPGED